MDFLEILEIGKGRIVRSPKDAKIAILSLGTRLAEALKAAEMLKEKGFSVTVADARFAKPIDKKLVRKLLENHELLVTVEEGAIGGFGSHILQFASYLSLPCKIITLTLPDKFIEQNTVEAMYDEAGLNADQIVKKILDAI